MSQNAKQPSLQLRRLATPPFCVCSACSSSLLPHASLWLVWHVVACCGMLWHVVACCGMHAHCVALCGISKNVFNLASNGCNMWEMELGGEL